MDETDLYRLRALADATRERIPLLHQTLHLHAFGASGILALLDYAAELERRLALSDGALGLLLTPGPTSDLDTEGF